MRIPISILLFFTLISCINNHNETAVIGKWAGVFESEYFEMHISSKEIFISSHWDVDRRPIKYSVKGDSLYYKEFDYSVGFRLINDSAIILGINEDRDTLCKLADNIKTYHEINSEDSVAFHQFYEAFSKRAKAYYAKTGIHQTLINDSTVIAPFEDEIMVITR